MMSSSDLLPGVNQSAAQTQANQYPDFALHTLGWKAFQDLIGVICSDVLGQTFQQFLPSKDAGRDGAFWGTWKMSGNEALAGSFTAQCKFTIGPMRLYLPPTRPTNACAAHEKHSVAFVSSF